MLNQVLERYLTVPYLHAYLDDLLAPGIVLGLCLSFFQQVFPADADFTLGKWMVLAFVIWYALLFELVFPSVDARHFSDPLDVLAYAIGGLIFYKFGNKPYRKSKVKS